MTRGMTQRSHQRPKFASGSFASESSRTPTTSSFELTVQLPVKPQDEIKVPPCSVQDVLIASDSPFPEELAGYVEKSVGGM